MNWTPFLLMVLAIAGIVRPTNATGGVTLEFGPPMNSFVAGEDFELSLLIQGDGVGELPRLEFFDVSILLNLDNGVINQVIATEPMNDYVFADFQPGLDVDDERFGLISRTFAAADGGIEEIVVGDGLYTDAVSLTTNARVLANLTISTSVDARGPLTFDVDRSFGELSFENLDPVAINYAFTNQSFTPTTAVPEPTTLLPLAAIAVGVARRRRR